MDASSNQDQLSNGGQKVRATLKEVASLAHCDVSLVSRKRKRGKSDAQIIREGVARWKRGLAEQARESMQQVAAEAEAEPEIEAVGPVAAPAVAVENDEALKAKAAANLQGATYDEAQRLKEIELYRRQKLANDEKEGSLIPAAEVEKGWSDIAAVIRDSILSVPLKIAGKLTGCTDEAQIERTLRAALRAELAKISEALASTTESAA